MSARKTPYWWAVIAEAKLRKKKGLPAFTYAHAAKAGDWQTCACGEQDPRIPRGHWGGPLDDTLDELGMQFYRAVTTDSTNLATRTLLAIEKRAAEVLAQVGK